ncbi:MAG: FAD-binding oxidoreductase [Gammaproteobacteria bacterium]|nr:FAD-binding oxidoreductase [Gammaproteobacteria bacterium]
MRECDFLIIGAGIAGASAAYHLCKKGSVIILEREHQPGYHSTGRSAAVFTENYGPRLMRVMSKVSGPFFRDPPPGFTDVPLLHTLGVLFVANADQVQSLESLVAELAELSDTIHSVDTNKISELAPALRQDYVATAAYDPSTMDMDVNSIHTGYLRSARAHGLEVVNNAEVSALEYVNGKWLATTPVGQYAAPVVINAAGAWADVIAEMAGARPIGLVPKRRTAIVFDPPAGVDVKRWTAVVDCQEQWYYKPDAGQVLASPADETPVAPQDIQPEELDIAVLVDRIQVVTTMEIKRINRSWAGLRSFVDDKCPVVGFAPDVEGIFWLAGQGGYGIQTSYALGLTAASLLQGDGVPRAVAAFNVSEADLGPQRLWR